MHPTTQKLFDESRYHIGGTSFCRSLLRCITGDWIRADDVRPIIQNEADAVAAGLSLAADAVAAGLVITAAAGRTVYQMRAENAEASRAEQAKRTKAAEAVLVEQTKRATAAEAKLVEQTKRATAAEAKLVELAKDIEVVDAHRAGQKQCLDCSWRHTQDLTETLRRTECLLASQRTRAEAAEFKLTEATDEVIASAHAVEELQAYLDGADTYAHDLMSDLWRAELRLVEQTKRAEAAAELQAYLDGADTYAHDLMSDLWRAELRLVEQTKRAEAAEAALAAQTDRTNFYKDHALAAQARAERAAPTNPVDIHKGCVPAGTAEPLNHPPVATLFPQSGIGDAGRDIKAAPCSDRRLIFGESRAASTDGDTWLRTPRSNGPHWYWSGASGTGAFIIDVAPPECFAPGFFQAIPSPVEVMPLPDLAAVTRDQWQLGPRCRGPHWYWSGARGASYVIKHVHDVTDEFAQGFYLRIPCPTLPTRAPEGLAK